MFSLSIKYPKFLLFISALMVCVCNIKAQSDLKMDDIEAKILQHTSSRLNYRCYLKNTVYDGQSFKKIVDNQDCVKYVGLLKIDFETQTLIGFEARGDCFIIASAKVFRNDQEKKYKVVVTSISGGCRASGTAQGLITIEKIPSDYIVEFSEIRKDKF